MNPQLVLVLVAAAVVLYVMVFAAMWASRYTKVGPNQALIISGRQRELPDGTRVGFRIVKGGGTFVWPAIEKVDVLSLEVLTVEMPKSNVRTAKGGSVEADCVAQMKIKSDDASISVAAEHFLSKELDEIKAILRPALERH